jgi:hypothetical protein
MATAATQMAKSKSHEGERGSHQATAPETGVSAEKSAPNETATEHRDPQKIAQLAYSYWQSRGGGDDSAEQDWFRAEAELYGSAATRYE